MAEARRSLAALSDEGLGEALRALAPAIALPRVAATATDPATRARQRLVEAGGDRRPSGWIERLGLRGTATGARSLRRSLVLALLALLVLAAVAGAVATWLPGIRIVFEEPPPSPTQSASPRTSPTRQPTGPVGSTMGLGTSVSIAEAERISGIDLVLPADPAIGPPDAVYVDRSRVSIVWGPRPGLPATTDEDGVALLISEFRGSIDNGYYEKILSANSRLTPVTVDGSDGFFITGAPHYFFYVDEAGQDVDASHRVVGDVLMWARGDVTYRVESGLAMDQAIELAESLE